jgi:hypothetical protein
LKGRYSKFRAAQAARGAKLSQAAAGNIASIRQPQLSWVVRVAMPFSYAASRNHVWTAKDRDHVSSRARSNAYRAELTTILRSALSTQQVKVNKLWLDIFVQKSDHKGDAVNVVDLVCDAVKDAAGLDDRWYALRSVDWEIVKGVGRLFVGVGQEECWDAIACSSCGRVLPLDMFASNKSNRQGRSRNCHGCRRGGT